MKKCQVIFSGGLGNQMFEYAFLLSLKKRGIDARLNTCMYRYQKMHSGFDLTKVFGVKSDPYLSNSFVGTNVIRALVKYLPKAFVYKDPGIGYYPEVYDTSKPFLYGCWIDEGYFKEYEKTIREVFVFRDIDDENYVIANEMKEREAVSLHIRRGDYLLYPRYCVCDEHWYEAAIKNIQETVKDPFFYVFSDDVVWCEQFLKGKELPFRIISHNSGKNSYQDMYLMTQCKHNIIANSTFSWWGAWLNSNPDKVVVCPKIWLNGIEQNPCLNDWVHI